AAGRISARHGEAAVGYLLAALPGQHPGTHVAQPGRLHRQSDGGPAHRLWGSCRRHRRADAADRPEPGLGRDPRPHAGDSAVVHIDRLLAQIALEAVLAVLAAEPAVAISRMIGMDRIAARTIDVDLAELQLAGKAHQPAQILGEDISG